MSPVRRRVFFWLLTLTFFVTTPVIVLFLMGYRYRFDRGIFIYTGSVSIQANPTQNLDIQIDGKFVSADSNRLNNSYHIEGVLPGKHTVSVSTPGFSTWSKEITVRSGIATEFWNILLARTEYPQETLASLEGGQAFFPFPQKNLVALVSEKNTETTVILLDTTTGNQTQVFSTTNFFLNKDTARSALRWSPKDATNFLLSLTSRETQGEHTFLVQTDTLAATDIKDIVRVPSPREVRWNSNANTLFFLSETKLFSLPLNTPLQETLLSDNVESFDTVGNTLIALEPKTGILYQFSTGDTANKRQLTTAPPEGFSQEYTPPFSLVAYDETRITILNRNTGDLFLFNKGATEEWFKRLSAGVKGVQFSDDGKKLLYWTDWEIFAFFTRKWDVQPVREENDRLDIGRFSSAIHDVQWTKDYEHVVFFSGNAVKAIELDDRGSRDTITILNLPTEPLQLSSIGSKNELLFLVPHTESNTTRLSSITFPEPTGFFGFGQ